MVERTLGWFNRYRRLSKDYEYLSKTSETAIRVAMIHLMIRRLARIASYWTRSNTTVVLNGSGGPWRNDCPTTVVVIGLGTGLMPAAPVGPRQEVAGGVRHRQDHSPEASAHLLDAPRHPRPRPALHAARRLPLWRGRSLVLHASTASAPARRMVRSA